MSTTTVSGSAALLSALSQAQGGDVIYLAAGAYSGLNLQNLSFPSGVTITSADPYHRAELHDLFLKNSSGLTFQGVDFVAGYNGSGYSFQLYGASGITFSGVAVHGSLDGNPTNDAGGFLFQNSDHITVVNSEFQQLAHAIGHVDNTNLTFTGNNFHDLRTGGIQGGGASNVLISGNSFSNFFWSSTPQFHPDAIQFWTYAESAPAHDITITGNTFSRGTGEPVQGIFIRDESGNLPFSNVTISDNHITGSLYRGISIDHVNGFSITGNTVQGFTDMEAWISESRSSNGVVSGNQATDYLDEGGNYNVSTWGNVTLAYIQPTTQVSTAPTAPTASAPVAPAPAPAPAPQPTSAQPTVPVDVHLAPAADSGVTGDGVTDTGALVIGGRADAAAYVTIFADGQTIGYDQADANGVFNIVASKLVSDGSHSITARASIGGVSGELSAGTTVVVDLDAVAPPPAAPAPTAPTPTAPTPTASALVTGMLVTPTSWANQVHIDGVYSGGQGAIAMFEDGVLINTQQTNAGAWSVTADVSAGASHVFTWQAIDTAGHVFDSSQQVIVGAGAEPTIQLVGYQPVAALA